MAAHRKWSSIPNADVPNIAALKEKDTNCDIEHLFPERNSDTRWRHICRRFAKDALAFVVRDVNSYPAHPPGAIRRPRYLKLSTLQPITREGECRCRLLPVLKNNLHFEGANYFAVPRYLSRHAGQLLLLDKATASVFFRSKLCLLRGVQVHRLNHSAEQPL